MKRLPLVLISMAVAGCGEGVPSSIETPRGTVTYKERVQPDQRKFNDDIRDPSPSEANHLKQSADRASAFIARYVPAEARHSDLLENLDAAFAFWLDTTNPTKESSVEVESIIGAAFGQYCVERLPVHWALATDSMGSEFALVGDNPPSRSYPFAAIRYRIEDHQTDFIGALYEALIHIRKEAS